MKKVFAYKSDLHGRYFWLGTSYDLQSCPFNTKDNPFLDQTDFVIDWQAWEDLETEQHQELLKIQRVLYCFEFMQTRFKNDMEDEELRHLRLINLEEG